MCTCIQYGYAQTIRLPSSTMLTPYSEREERFLSTHLTERWLRKTRLKRIEDYRENRFAVFVEQPNMVLEHTKRHSTILICLQFHVQDMWLTLIQNIVDKVCLQCRSVDLDIFL